MIGSLLYSFLKSSNLPSQLSEIRPIDELKKNKGMQLPVLYLSLKNLNLIIHHFQHYCHHSKSVMNIPYHCGFFFKIWDQLFDCTYPEEKCFCAECSRSKGERSKEAFDKITIPDYSKLFSTQLWFGKLSKSITS